MRSLSRAFGYGLLCAAAVGAFVLLAPYYSTHVLWFLRATAPYLVPLVCLAVAAVLAFAHLTSRSDRGDSVFLLGVGYVIAGLLIAVRGAVRVTVLPARRGLRA